MLNQIILQLGVFVAMSVRVLSFPATTWLSLLSLNNVSLNVGIHLLLLKQDGIARTIASFSHYSRDSSYRGQGDFPDQSKADWMLGGGKGCIFFLLHDI